MGEWLLDHGFPVIFYSLDETIYFFDHAHPINETGRIGDSISILPIKNSVLIHQTIGLKYSLWEETLPRNSTRGLSNELANDTFEVSISKGQAFIVHTRSE